MPRRRRVAFRRRDDGMIEVDLPSAVVRAILDATERVRQAGDSPGTAAFERLHAQVEQDREEDEPAVVLERQLSIDAVTERVAASVAKRVISADDAEAWLQVLGMTLACMAAEHGLVDEATLHRLPEAAIATIDLVRALQIALIGALDG